MTAIQWSDSAPIYRQLKERVIAMMLDGLLKPGDALPSVRQVAAEYQLNPITVSRAYQELADEALVEKRRGLGMYVTEEAARKLLFNERERFLREEWPQVVERIKRLGLEKHARIVKGDILKQDYSSADLITVYLLPSAIEKVRPVLDKQLKKGTRRLQLENVMKAKFDTILVPIANELIAKDQLRHVTFDAFFENVMFHEVAHGLGIKKTLDGKGTVDEALKEYASSFEEGKADILGLYMIDALSRQGELDESRLMDGYVTFLAGILRSVRFGASDAHGKANMVRFNFFAERGAFTRDADGRYRIDFDKMREAMNALGAKLLTVQGDGDYAEARRMTGTMGVIKPELAADLARLKDAKIPVDIRFEQGLETLGLQEFASKK